MASDQHSAARHDERSPEPRALRPEPDEDGHTARDEPEVVALQERDLPLAQVVPVLIQVAGINAEKRGFAAEGIGVVVARLIRLRGF